MNRMFELIWLRIREYFKHPAEDIRQAQPIVPGRLYANFGYICKAVPYNKREKDIIRRINSENGEGRKQLLYNTIMEEIGGCKIEGIGTVDCVQEETDRLNEMDCHCVFCDFHRKAIPCPLYNTLEDGSTVCDTYKYVILKNQR